MTNPCQLGSTRDQKQKKQEYLYYRCITSHYSEKFASFKKRSTDLPDTPKASNTSIHDVERGDTDSLSTIVNHPSGSGMTCAVDIKEVLIALHPTHSSCPISSTERRLSKLWFYIGPGVFL